MAESFSYKPIGFFKTSIVNSYDLPRQPDTTSVLTNDGYIELLNGFHFEQALENLLGFSKIWVIFEFHRNHHWNAKILPPRGSEIKVGLFSTRSPYRPNPIGLSCLDLIGINGLKIYVVGSDILNESPILDIKPYVPHYDSHPQASAGWLENIDSQKYQISFSEPARIQTEYLLAKHKIDLYSFIKRSLEFEPCNQNKKRLLKNPKSRDLCYQTLCYRTWRILFSVDHTNKLIQVLKIKSGYTFEELVDGSDPYTDKKVHKDFIQAFGN